MSDLLKKLQSMGLKIEKGLNFQPDPRSQLSIDKVIQGEWIESHGERIYLSRKFYPFGYIHGNVVIKNEFSPETIPQFWGIDHNYQAIQLSDFLFLDTETSGLSLGTGSIVFLFGGCFFTINGLEVFQFFLDDPSCESLFLANIENLIQKHICLVSYNGKAFDVPMLRSRMVLNHMPPASLLRPHIDLLHYARNLWKLRLESRKLSDIEKEIMSFQRSEDEVPGWLVPQLYQDFIISGDASPLKGVFYHNEKDIVSLAALFLHINEMVSDQKIIDSSNILDIISIGTIFQKSGNLSQSEIFYKLGEKKGIPTDLDSKIFRNYAGLMKKQKNWSEAIRIWEIAANKNDPISCIELAKYYEHLRINLDKALAWVDTAIDIVTNASDSNKLSEELSHRKNRLKGKINSSYEK